MEPLRPDRAVHRPPEAPGADARPEAACLALASRTAPGGPAPAPQGCTPAGCGVVRDQGPLLCEAVMVRNLFVLGRLWARRASGVLDLRDGSDEVVHVLLHEGGPTDRGDLVELANRLDRIDLSFHPVPTAGPGDRAGLGAVLFHGAHMVARLHDDLPAEPVDVTLRLPLAVLEELPLPTCMVQHVATLDRSSRQPVALQLARPDRECRQAITALRLLGFVVVGLVDGGRREVAEHASAPESTEELLALDLGLELDEHAPGLGTSLLVDSRQGHGEALVDLLVEARWHVRAERWAEAEAALVRARDIRLDSPEVLALLAWVRLQHEATPGPETCRECRRWIELAYQLAPSDSDVLRLYGLVGRRLTELALLDR